MSSTWRGAGLSGLCSEDGGVQRGLLGEVSSPERLDAGFLADPANVLAGVARHLGDVSLKPAVVANRYNDRCVQVLSGLVQALLGAFHTAYGRYEVAGRHASIFPCDQRQHLSHAV